MAGRNELDGTTCSEIMRENEVCCIVKFFSAASLIEPAAARKPVTGRSFAADPVVFARGVRPTAVGRRPGRAA